MLSFGRFPLGLLWYVNVCVLLGSPNWTWYPNYGFTPNTVSQAAEQTAGAPIVLLVILLPIQGRILLTVFVTMIGGW